LKIDGGKANRHAGIPSPSIAVLDPAGKTTMEWSSSQTHRRGEFASRGSDSR
jgi:hypothetical protein